MNLSITSIFKQLGNFYKKFSKGTKIFAFVSLAAIIIGAIIIASIMNSGKYIVLYRGLSSTESSEIYSVLKKMSVDVKVEGDGTLLVPTSEEATLKMQLASEGFPKSTLNYDLFTDKTDLFTTDYQKKQMLIFQLQDRLQNSIKTLQGVSNAIVNLSIPEDNSYVLKDEKIDITASVILELFTSCDLSKKQINGIEQLVANSVPGLISNNVAIINSQGEQLNTKNSEEGVDNAYLKIETVNIINKVFEDKIKSFLKPIFGDNGLSIAVNVDVDFDKVSSEEKIYTPVIGDNGIISWVERSGKSSGSDNGSSGVPGTGSNTDGVPTYTESDDTSNETDTSSDIIISENYSANYLVNQLVKVIQDNGGSITDMTVSVIINSKELSDENIVKYKELVANSAGISVDKVVLTNAEFLPSSNVSFPEESNPPGVLMSLGTQEIVIIGSTFVGFIIVLVIIIILAKKRKKKNIKTKIEEQLEEAIAGKTREKMPGEIVLNETREQALKRQIKEFSTSSPETVAQLLRVWIKEDDNN